MRVIILQMFAIKNWPLLWEAVRRARRGEQAKTAEKRKEAGATDPMDGRAWGRISPYDK